MSTQQIFNRASEAYRDFPLLDAKFIKEPERTEVKQIFALLLSQKRLLETIEDHEFSEDYHEKSPVKATFMTRLADIESQLIRYEGKYGKLSEIGYITQPA